MLQQVLSIASQPSHEHFWLAALALYVFGSIVLLFLVVFIRDILNVARRVDEQLRPQTWTLMVDVQQKNRSRR